MAEQRNAKSSRRRGKKKQARESREAYLMGRLPVGERACRWAWDVARDAGLDDDQRAVWFHVLGCQFVKGAHEPGGWVPVPWIARHRFARGADMAAIQAAGLLEYWAHSDVAHRCARYRLPERLLFDFGEVASTDLPGAPRYDLFTGQVAVKARPQLYCANRRPLPRLLRQVIDSVSPHGIFNLDDAKDHLERFRKAYLAASGEKRKTKFGRYMNDVTCLNAIYAQEPLFDMSGFGWFVTPYRVTATGRLSFPGGGTMSCSKAMKAAGYGRLAGVHNYDVASSQAAILRDMLDEAQIDSGWLNEYMANGKAPYAKAAGLTVDDWKTVIYAIFMSASLPKPENAWKSTGAVAKVIREAHGDDGFEEGYRQLYGVLSGLTSAIDEWHDQILRRATRRSKRGRYKKVKNDIGLLFDPATCWTPYDIKSQLAAHLLQGREAYFVAHFAIRGVKYGYLPVAHEHDGLVTIGEIPEAAIEEARDASGISSLELVEKPFEPCRDNIPIAEPQTRMAA